MPSGGSNYLPPGSGPRWIVFSSELVVQLTLYIADLTLTDIVVFCEWKNCKESDYESDRVLTNILQAENTKYQNVERCHAGEFVMDF